MAIPFNDLDARQCRWPDGYDEAAQEHLFCGQAAQVGGPYCKCHYDLAFAPRDKKPVAQMNRARPGQGRRAS